MMCDWEELWNQEIRLSRREKLGEIAFWDKAVSEGGTDNPRLAQLTEEQIRLIDANSHSTVLEIGPGVGRLTLPLAKLSAGILAVEPSQGMAAELQKRLDAESAGNVRIAVEPWQTYSPQLKDDSWDIVLASYSLFMVDVGPLLREMSRVARERVCLFVPAQKRMSPELELAVTGENLSSPHPDSVIISKIVESQGHYPELKILERQREDSYGTMEEALEQKARFHSCPPERLPHLREHLENTLVKEDGKLWERELRRSAFISWTP